jgi:hypothetical protein
MGRYRVEQWPVERHLIPFSWSVLRAMCCGSRNDFFIIACGTGACRRGGGTAAACWRLLVFARGWDVDVSVLKATPTVIAASVQLAIQMAHRTAWLRGIGSPLSAWPWGDCGSLRPILLLSKEDVPAR